MNSNSSENMGSKETESLILAKVAYQALDNKIADDIMVLDIHTLTVIADIFVIATGKNDSHIKALADEVEFKLKEMGATPKNIEGYQSAKWVLLDFGFVVVHIFNEEQRQFYNLERIWGDAEHISF